MKPFYADSWLTVYEGDCRTVMAEMEPESVHCVVTSPPYWGLRDYGTATWIGGDEGCDHRNGPLASPKSTLMGYTGPDVKLATGGMPFKGTCGKCGATREDSQLGLEPTPEEYVANMVAVFREVRRVLRADGTVWLNLGDSYASHDPGERRDGEFLNPDGVQYDKGRKSGPAPRNRAGSYRPGGLMPKNLVGIPWRVAFALQADGWYLRSDIIWSKPNPMPESVTDRPTKAHEYLFLLSKSPRYYYDADAVRETAHYTEHNARYGVAEPVKVNGHRGDLGGGRFVPSDAGGRNIRSVWTVATQPYPGAHFATFPPKLVEPCIKAGTSERGVCSECGAPWERETRKDVVAFSSSPRYTGNGDRNDSETGRTTTTTTTTGWRPSCAHAAEPVPATILDPFAGSGTTGKVAQSLGRRAVLIDLNGEYLKQAMIRNADIPLGLEAS